MKPSMRQLLSALVVRMSASAWARPAGRVALGLLGALVLAWIGRSVAVGGVVPPAAAAPSPEPAALQAPTDAGASTELRDPSPPPSDASAPAAQSAQRHAARASAADPVYLNEASIDELRRLPGIGEKRALAIVELRGKLGRFRQVEDLLRVKGIGRASLRKLRPIVRLDSLDAGPRA